MIKSMRRRPPYSQVVIVDPSIQAQVPEWTKGASVVSTDTCILFACLAEMDGETEFTLGDVKEVAPGTHPAFEGTLKTPSRRIALETVEGTSLLQMQTQQQETIVRIWANKAKEPDKVVVGIG
jgi:hypothetical protein